MQSRKYKRIAVKIGSNVLAGANGDLNMLRIAHIVDQISKLKKQGTEVILISSGAVAARQLWYGLNFLFG